MADSPTTPAPSAPTSWAALRTDLVAGLTNGVLSVPQGIAFALIAGVEPIYGLFAMIVPTLVAAVFRSSPYLMTGSTNTSALVLGVLLLNLPGDAAGMDKAGVMALVTLLIGGLQVAFGALRLGAVGRYVSNPVLTGFTLAAAAVIAGGQLKNLCGLTLPPVATLFWEIETWVENVHRTDWRALVLAGLALGTILGCRALAPRLPGPLLAIALAGGVVALAGWNQDPSAVPLVGAIPRELHAPQLPDVRWSLMDDVLTPAIAIAILGAMETLSIGKALAARARIGFAANRELVANGLGNVVGSITGCMPASASWTRSAINLEYRVQTRWAGVTAAVSVLVIVLLFAPWAVFIPKAAVAAILIWISVRMVDPAAIRKVWRWSQADRLVMIATLVSALVLEIQYAVYVGVGASLLLLLRRVGSLHMAELAERALGQFREVEVDEQTGRYPVVVLQLEGDVFFGVGEELAHKLEQIASAGARVIVLRLKRALAIDATAAEALADFADQFREQGGRLILCGVKPTVLRRIARSHLGEALGPDNLLPTAERPFESVLNAVALAKRHVLAALPDWEGPLVRPARDEGWMYEI